MTVTQDEITKVLGSVDPTMAAMIAATGATRQELEEACTWIREHDCSDLASSKPSGTVGRLVEMLALASNTRPA